MMDSEIDSLKSEIVCRFCLSIDFDKGQFYNVNAKISTKSLAEMFNSVSGLSIETDDPQTICPECWKNLLTTYEFLELVQATEAKLRNQSRFSENSDIKPFESLDSATLWPTEEFNERKTKEKLHKTRKYSKTKQKRIDNFSSTCSNAELSTVFMEDECEASDLLVTCLDLKKEPEQEFTRNFSCSFCWEEYEGQCQCPPEPTITDWDTDPYKIPKRVGRTHWLCEHCSKEYTDINNFTAHNNRFTRRERIVCELCSATFQQKKDLTKHQLRHDNLKQNKLLYECDICSKAFVSKYILSNHLDTHRTERKYECPICSKRFKARGTLNVHKKVHRKDRDYECPECFATFFANATLRLHIQKYHPEYPLPPKGTIMSKRGKHLLKSRLTLNDNDPAFALVKYRGLDAKYDHNV